ncbi:MAG: ExbD/TolR family protein, partial [Opitutales bacterium]
MLDLELSGETEINLSPMIDCIFILLIFFIVTTVFVQESGIDVEKPEASNSTPLPKNSILIAITETGRIYHGG